MPKLVITIGLPASGKTTYINSYMKKNKNKNFCNINLDDIRAMMAGSLSNYKYTKDSEETVVSVRNNTLELLATEGRNIIISDTNLNQMRIKQLVDTVLEINNNYHIVYIDTFDMFIEQTPELQTLPEYFQLMEYFKFCLKNDVKRGEHAVGTSVIKRMFEQYYLSGIEPKVTRGNKPALIVDIDGTLAHMSGRSPYEYEKVNTDRVDEEIASMVGIYKHLGYNIIIVSGRDDNCMDVTTEWLNDNSIEFDDIFMRKTGDQRGDHIVKYEIFLEHINGVYNVDFVLDDRDKVVHMWRHALGLKVLQVAEGDF